MTRPQTTPAFIARMKLEALRTQRDALQSGYDQILAEVEAAGGGREGLRRLYDGLRAIRLAGEPVHPNLPDLTAVLRFVSDEEARQWRERLGAELERGRARSEAVYAFGALLEEAAGDRAAAVDDSGRAAYLSRVTGDPGAPPPALEPGGLLEQLFDEDGFGRMTGAVARAFEAGFGTVEVDTADGGTERKPAIDSWAIIGRLVADRERSPAIRAEARGYADELSEAGVALRDALEMSLADPTEWRWPEGPLELRAVQTADRVRFHPELDLVSLLVLEQLAAWFAMALPRLHTGHVNRRQRLDRLIELNAPEIIIANEREHLEREVGLLNDPRVLEPTLRPGSIAANRDLGRAHLWESGLVAGSHYGAGGYAADSGGLVRLLNAEIRSHRQTDRPLFVVRADVADCFASIDHRVILAMIERLGVPEAYRSLVERFLAVPVAGGRFRRGVPLGLSLSRGLVDQVLGAIELHARRAGVETARVVDDFVLWSDDPGSVERGYAALVEAVEAFGLELQPAKVGAAAIGGARPPGLPTSPVYFNLLRLDPEGFAVDGERLDRLRDETAAAMDEAPSTLAAVRLYNSQARFVVDSLVPAAELAGAGGDHLAACSAAAARFAEGVEARLRARVEGVCTLAHPLPRAWLYWPVSAGGLGLRDLRLDVGSISDERLPAPDEPYDEIASTAWGRWYHHLGLTDRVSPRADAVGKAQIDDFIARGGELRGQTQTDLGPYWRWVLTTWGPEILERFGTFRFLLRKLVPLDLLSSS